MSNPRNGDCALPAEAPTPGWLLTPELTLEQQLAIRADRIAGLDRRATENDKAGPQ
jgi:hypothetical protein